MIVVLRHRLQSYLDTSLKCKSSTTPRISLGFYESKEQKMAEVDTNFLATQHNDIRKEAVDHTNDIIKEGLKGDYSTLTAVKDSRCELSNRIESSTDRIQNAVVAHNSSITDRLFELGRDSADIRAQVTQSIAETRAAADRTAKDAQIAVLQNTIEAAKNTSVILEKVSNDGYETRRLVNELKATDLNRMLIERGNEISEHRGRHDHWRGAWDQSQFAGIHTQLQAVGSQLQETRQGMVNFGTMLGTTQASSSNSV